MWTEYFPATTKKEEILNAFRGGILFFYFFKSVFVVVVVFSTSEIHDGKVLISFNLLAFLCFPYFLLIFPSTLMVLNVDISKEKKFRLNLLDFILDNFLPQHDLKFSIKRIFKVRAEKNK